MLVVVTANKHIASDREIGMVHRPCTAPQRAFDPDRLVVATGERTGPVCGEYRLNRNASRFVPFTQFAHAMGQILASSVHCDLNRKPRCDSYIEITKGNSMRLGLRQCTEVFLLQCRKVHHEPAEHAGPL